MIPSSDGSSVRHHPARPTRRRGIAAVVAILGLVGALAGSQAQADPAGKPTPEAKKLIRWPVGVASLKEEFESERARTADAQAAAAIRALRPDTSPAAPSTRRSGVASAPTAEQALARPATGGPWSLLGPFGGERLRSTIGDNPPRYNQSGRAGTLAIAPGCTRTACTVYLGTAAGGVWKSDDALAAVPRWRPIFDGQATQSIGHIALDPRNPSIVYVGTGEATGPAQYAEAGTGLYRSTDAGRSWTRLAAAPFAGRGISTVAIDPSDSRRLYVSTVMAWHGRASVRPGQPEQPPGAAPTGVYRSTDGGRSWSLVLNRPHPFGLYGDATKLVIDPTRPKLIYAGVTGYGLFRSMDGGTGWQRIAGPIHPRDPVGDRFEFDLAPKRPDRLYLGIGNGSIGAGEGAVDESRFYRSDDAAAARPVLRELSSDQLGRPGRTSLNFCGIRCYYTMGVTADPANPDVVYLAGSGQGDDPEFGLNDGRIALRSTDAGVTFSDVTGDSTGSRVHADGRLVVPVPGGTGVWFALSDGGIHRGGLGGYRPDVARCADPKLTADQKLYCERIRAAVPRRVEGVNAGLPTLQFQRVAVDPRNAGRILGGTQDNGFYALERGRWNSVDVFAGDGGNASVDVSDPDMWFGTTYPPGLGTVTVNGFDDFAVTGKGMIDFETFTPAEDSAVYTLMESDTSRSGWAYNGLQRIWRTTTGGGGRDFLRANCTATTLQDPGECGDWQPLGSTPLTASNPQFGSDKAGTWVAWLAQSRSSPQVAYAATAAGRIFISRNFQAADPATVTWARVDGDRTPARFVTGIVVDPTNPEVIHVSYSGFAGYDPETPTHVLRIDVRGGTVTDLSADLPDLPVLGLAMAPGSRTLYAAGPFGVWTARLSAAGRVTGWLPLGTGMPRVPVYGLTYHEGSKALFAATHGRGVWRIAAP